MSNVAEAHKMVAQTKHGGAMRGHPSWQPATPSRERRSVSVGGWVNAFVFATANGISNPDYRQNIGWFEALTTMVIDSVLQSLDGGASRREEVT